MANTPLPRTPRAGKNAEEMVCPVCFTVFPPGKIKPAFPTCPHCESEAIGVEVERVTEFLQRLSLPELRRIAEEWRRQTGFLKSYKQEKLRRIRALVVRRRALPESRERPRT